MRRDALPPRGGGCGWRAAALAVAVLGSTVAATPGAEAQVSPQSLTGIELTLGVRESLRTLQEKWLQWVGAFYQSDPAVADGLVTDLLDTARELEAQRLPDLSVGAAAQALDAAHRGDFRHAQWGLSAAERLDPGRPETAFARAAVAWRRGSYLSAVVAQLSGYLRLANVREYRLLWLHDASLIALYAVLLASAGFVVLQLASKGRALFRELERSLGSWLPAPVVPLGILVLLVWPLALPAGFFWLLVYWSILVWGFGNLSERMVLLAAWIVVGASPILVARQQQHVNVVLSPPYRAMDALEEGRLYGALFSDLGVLDAVLPQSAAVKQLRADLHRMLGQWEEARSLLREVVSEEPENAPALVGLGAYYFRKGDFGRAVMYFRRATEADPRNAPAYYNLSLSFSESYLFDDQREALSKAREIDEESVNRWIQRPDRERIQAPSGGLARLPEIRHQLAAVWGPGPQVEEHPRLVLLRAVLPLLLPIAAILLAVAVGWIRGSRAARPVRRGGKPGQWTIALLPGWEGTEEGHGLRTFLAVAAPLWLLLLPMSGLAYGIPWPVDPGRSVPLAACLLGLACYFGLRCLWVFRWAP